MMPQCHGWGWFPLQTTSYIHIRHIQSVWDIGMLSQGNMGAPLFCYTLDRLAPVLGTQGCLWSEHDAITSWLRLISTHLWVWLFHASAHTTLQHQEVLPHHVPIWRTNLLFLVKPLSKDQLISHYKLGIVMTHCKYDLVEHILIDPKPCKFGNVVGIDLTSSTV